MKCLLSILKGAAAACALFVVAALLIGAFGLIWRYTTVLGVPEPWNELLAILTLVIIIGGAVGAADCYAGESAE